MPLPIICASDALCQYLALFRAVFSKPQWQYFVTVLLALLQSEDRRTLSGLLRKVVAGVSLAGLSRFFARAPWDESALARVWLTHFHTTIQVGVQAEHQRQRAARPKRRRHPKATLVTSYLVLDDSTHVKPKGRQMEGLGLHHSTTEHRRVSGHSLFLALWVVLGRHCPLAPQLYRTRSVCQKEGVAFQSKIDLAAQLLETLTPLAGTQAHVLMDAWYTCQRLWRIARTRGFACSGGVKSNRKLRRQGADGKRYWQALSAYAAELASEQFQALTWPAQDGGRTIYVHVVRTLVHRLGACQVVIVRERLDAPLKETRYFVTSLLTADAQTIVNHLAVRWDIETLFADLKELFGSDHYQGMTARAVVRFWTVGCCAYFFLDAQRAARPISIGQVRREIQAVHQFNLLKWLSAEFQQGLTPAQIQTKLA